MKTNFLLSFGAALLLATNLLHADTPKSVDYSTGHGVGLAAGFNSGIGLSYRKFFTNGVGYQVAAGFIMDPSYNESVGRRFYSSLGAQAYYTFGQTSWLRFYGLVGVGVLHRSRHEPTDEAVARQDAREKQRQEAWDNKTKPVPKPIEFSADDYVRQNTFDIFAGPGIGFEFNPIKNLAITLEVALDGTFNLGYKNKGFERIFPLPSASIIYYF